MPWPFYTSSEKQLQGLKNRITELQHELNGVVETVNKLNLLYQNLQQQHENLQAQHVRLRGHVYGTEGGRPTTKAPTPLPRDQLRALAGIRAGVPFPHRDNSSEE